ncbi:MAG: pyruvate formate lyase family protein, partial [Cyanobacteria bacterium J06635_11]
MVSTPLKSSISTPKAQTKKDAWEGFAPGDWTQAIAVRDFIQHNYRPYEGDRSFLAEATPRTQQLWAQISVLMKQEREQGILDADTKVPAGITAHAAGYVDAGLEQIVGVQTDQPLKRSIMPLGGIRVVEKSLEAYGYSIDPSLHEIFTKYRKTHNDGVFD